MRHQRILQPDRLGRVPLPLHLVLAVAQLQRQGITAVPTRQVRVDGHPEGRREDRPNQSAKRSDYDELVAAAWSSMISRQTTNACAIGGGLRRWGSLMVRSPLGLDPCDKGIRFSSEGERQGSVAEAAHLHCLIFTRSATRLQPFSGADLCGCPVPAPRPSSVSVHRRLIPSTLAGPCLSGSESEGVGHRLGRRVADVEELENQLARNRRPTPAGWAAASRGVAHERC